MNTERKRFIEKLLEYRDIVMLVVLIITGFLWIYNSFATRNQLKMNTCVLKSNMEISIIQFREELLIKDQLKNNAAIAELNALKKSGSKVDSNIFENLRVEEKNLEEDLEFLKKRRIELISKLGECIK